MHQKISHTDHISIAIILSDCQCTPHHKTGHRQGIKEDLKETLPHVDHETGQITTVCTNTERNRVTSSKRMKMYFLHCDT